MLRQGISTADHSPIHAGLGAAKGVEMPNMRYCRFQNTLDDLQDCYESMNETVDGAELTARNTLIRLCKSIAEYDEE